MAKKKNSLTSKIAGTLSVLAIGLGIFVKNFDDYRPGWGARAFGLVILFFMTALILWQWEENHYRFNLDSIPVPLQILTSLAGLFLFVSLNFIICKWRLGNESLAARPLSTIVIHLFVLLLGIGIHFGSYYNEMGGGLRSVRWMVAAIFLSGLSAILLNFVFYADVGDLETRMIPTQRCFVGGRGCYDVGREAWGGTGTTFLMAVNLLQGILLVNAVSGFYFLWKKQKMKGPYV